MTRSAKNSLARVSENGRPAKKKQTKSPLAPPSRFYGTPLPGVRPEELSGTLIELTAPAAPRKSIS
jgi:hypothetical protein